MRIEQPSSGRSSLGSGGRRSPGGEVDEVVLGRDLLDQEPPSIGRVDRNQETGSPWVIISVILVAAFCFRILLGYHFAFYGGDAAGYTTLATNLSSLHGYSVAHQAPYIASDIRVPAYPALLAVAFAIHMSHW